ncbi:MAG: hypothetical protein ABI790_05755 [Betaproteobacteria bacterium]
MKSAFKLLFVAMTATVHCAANLAGAADATQQKTPATATKSISGPEDDGSLAALKTGIGQVERFFGRAFPRPFSVRFHSHRIDMDKQWAEDWKSPGLKSECWMVASGVGEMLDLLSPAVWASEACEHDARDTDSVQKLISHELTHVFHGQLNPSSDFSDVEGLDWFVEGLAVYASGQLNGARLAAVREAVKDNKVPASLDDFWKGRLRYGQSGSVVAWIDDTYGRATTIQLMSLTKKAALLEKLGLTEARLLTLWRASLPDKP